MFQINAKWSLIGILYALGGSLCILAILSVCTGFLAYRYIKRAYSAIEPDEKERLLILTRLPVHAAIINGTHNAQQMGDLLDDEIAIRSIHELDIDGCMAIDLAIKHKLTHDIIMTLMRHCLPIGFNSVGRKEMIDISKHGFAWATIVQRDEFVDVVEQILQEFSHFATDLAGSCDAHDRPLINIASPRNQRMIRQCLYLFQRFEIVSNFPHHQVYLRSF